MSKNWDYAILVKDVKHAGGRQAFMQNLIEEGKEIGRLETEQKMNKKIPLLLSGAVIAGVLLDKGIEWIKNKKNSSYEAKKVKIKQDIKRDSENFINSINEHEENHDNQTSDQTNEQIDDNKEAL